MMTPLGTTALTQYAVNINNKIEELAWSYYDFATYANLGQTNLTFFQNPVGAGGKTLEDTNMVSAGQIPKGQNFLVEAIAVEFAPGAVINNTTESRYADDVKAVAEHGWLNFTIASKPYKTEGPLGIFPPQYRQMGYAAADTTVAATDRVVEYASNTGTLHEIIPLRLTSNQNFVITLNWATPVILPSVVDGRIGVRLLGRLFRNAQ